MSSQPMKFVIAPDSFKESLDAITAAETITAGMRRVLPDAQYPIPNTQYPIPNTQYPIQIGANGGRRRGNDGSYREGV